MRDYDLCSKSIDINNELTINSILEYIPYEVTSSLDIIEFENGLMNVVNGLLLNHYTGRKSTRTYEGIKRNEMFMRFKISF